MTQHIRNCANNTNLGIVKCDAYRERLLSREKQAGPREGSKTHVKKSSSSRKSRPVSQPANTRDSSSLSIETSSKRQHRSNSTNRQPWSALLQSSKSIDSMSPLDNCDPLRTVHFLSQELSSRLKSASLNDPTISDLIVNMQHAITRVPSEIPVTNVLSSKQSKEICKVNGYHREIPVKLIPETPRTINQSCQANLPQSSFPNSLLFDRQLQASTTKLQINCEQLQISYNNLKKEKDQFENLFLLESEKADDLKKQNTTLQQENTYITQQRNDLEGQLKSLKIQGNVNESKVRLEQLENQKAELDDENVDLRHKIATLKVEKEKYIALLAMRDRQINEILNEIDTLQTIISEQLLEFERVATVSSASSATNL